MQRLPRWREGRCARPAAPWVVLMLGKTVVEAALLDHLDGSLLDYLDRSLLDHRAAAGDGSASTPGRQVAPEQQRVQHGNQAGEQQDDPEGVDVDAGSGGLHGEGQDGAEHHQKDADSDAHLPPSFTASMGHIPTCSSFHHVARPQTGCRRYEWSFGALLAALGCRCVMAWGAMTCAVPRDGADLRPLPVRSNEP